MSAARPTGRQVLAAVMAISATLAPPHSFAQRAKIIDRLPVEVVAKIVWQGRELELRKVISCDQRRRMHPGPDWDRGLRLREIWDQSTLRVSHVLPSREVLIFDLPVVCNELQKRVTPPRSGFLPRIIWVDNADFPKAGEQIVSYRYFQDNPRRRFEFVQFQMVHTPLAEIDDDQQLIWLLQSSGKPDAYFIAVTAAALPKSVWGRFSGLASELEARATGVIERRVVAEHARVLLWGCDSHADGIGPAERCLFSQFDDRPFAVSATRMSADVWDLDLTDTGVRRFAHLVSAAELDSKGCNVSFTTCNLFKGNYRLRVEGRTYEIAKVNGDLIFDADRQLLIDARFRVLSSTYVNPHRVDQ